MNFLVKYINKLKYLFIALFLLPLFSVGICNASKDLMQIIMEPADKYGTTIHISNTAKGVGQDVFEGSVQPLDPLNEGLGYKKVPSIIAKVTRVLLSLVVALSITMILYHGLKYIIQTGQGKEGKDLITSVVYIVIGILVSLFSWTIITILQSVSTTLEEETQLDWHRNSDGKVVNNERKGIIWSEVFSKKD